MKIHVGCFSKRNLGGSSKPDYSRKCKGYSATFYNSLHIVPVPLQVKMDSLLNTLNSDVDHYNTQNGVENTSVLHALTAD